MFFGENGDFMMGYDILNLVSFGNNTDNRAVQVGRFNSLASPGEEMVIDDNLITWNSDDPTVSATDMFTI